MNQIRLKNNLKNILTNLTKKIKEYSTGQCRKCAEEEFFSAMKRRGEREEGNTVAINSSHVSSLETMNELMCANFNKILTNCSKREMKKEEISSSRQKKKA